MPITSILVLLFLSALLTPKGADVFPEKAIVPPPSTGRIFMFMPPPGAVASNYVTQLEETVDLDSGHWWTGPTGYQPGDMDSNGVVTIRATQPQRFYRLRWIPKSQLATP